MPGRVVIVTSVAPRLPSERWGQCRHRQENSGYTEYTSLKSARPSWAVWGSRYDLTEGRHRVV